MIKQLILFFVFASLVYGNECAGNYSVYDVIDKLEDTYKNEDNISIDHRMFWEINDPQNPEHDKEKLEKIIKGIEDCLLSEQDTTSHFLVKSYRAVFFYRIGNFEQSKKMTAQIDKWKANLGTEIFNEGVKKVLSVHSFLNEEFTSQTGNEDFGTMMIRVIPFSKESPRKVPESTLVDKYGDPIELSIMLPGDGLQILEGLSKKRFKYLSNNKKEISFDRENDETRSFEMELNFLPLIPDDKKYTFIVKDNLGNIFRYKKRFSKTTNVKDRVLEIDFDRSWLVKEDAPQGQIKIELPRSDEYTIEVRDHMGDTVEPRTSRKDQQGNEIDIYYLKKTDPNNPHDFEIIYLEKEEKILGVNKWAYRLVLMVVTLAPILLVL